MTTTHARKLVRTQTIQTRHHHLLAGMHPHGWYDVLLPQQRRGEGGTLWRLGEREAEVRVAFY